MSTETSAESRSDEAVNPNLNILEFIGAGNYSAEHDLSLAQHSPVKPVDITPCSIGLLGLGKCSSTKILKRDLDVDEQKLLKIRTGVLSLKNNICSIHFQEYLKNYSNKQQRSCGVRLKCSGSRTQDLRPINYSDYVKSRQFGCGQFLLVPGQVRCVGCRLYCHKIVKEEIERRKREKEIMEAEGKHYLEPEDPGSPDISDCESESTSADNSESASTSQSAGTSQSHPNKRVHSDEDFPTPPEIAREKLNNALMLFGKSPVDSRKFVKSKKYAAEKTEELQASVSGSVQKVAGEVTVKDSELVKEYMEMLSQLKEKFNLPETSLTEKFIILSILPPSWTLHRMTDFFQCSRYMARVVKDKVALQGILCSPNPRPGRRLDEETVKKVILFYEDDRHSRLLPGKRDFKTVKIDGERVQIQKRLLLLTVGELYEVFKEECPTYKVSISKFAELRPLYVVLAGAAGTHSVCVCTIHQNVKLMMCGAKLREGAEDMEGLESVSECLSLILCNVPTEECYFGTCTNCPGVSDVVEKIQLIFDLNMVSIVEYKQWVSVDRSDLITISQDCDEFIDIFCDRLKDLVEHDFIAKQQGNFFSEIKSNLKEGEVFVVGDFSMNYKPVIQDAAQSYHWSNASITLHPFVCYYSASGVVEHKSYAMISDYLIHDTAAVYSFQVKLIECLKVEIPNLKKNYLLIRWSSKSI